MVRVNDELEIPEAELELRFARSSGPGGQNVNKVETKVTLLFDVEASTRLSAAHKARLRERLGRRIGRDGVLRVVSQRYRTQASNRRAVIVRFAELLAEALAEDPSRTPTRVPKRERRRRLEAKRRRARAKALRAAPEPDD